MGSYFTDKYEVSSNHEAIDHDLERVAGTTVLWFRWNPDSTVDDVYDVGEGRDWHDPVTIDVVSAARFEGEERNLDLGAYSTDDLHLVIRSDVADRLLPGLDDPQVNDFLKDRVVYEGTVFTVMRVASHGHFKQWNAIYGIDLREVDPDQLVHDNDFSEYATP